MNRTNFVITLLTTAAILGSSVIVFSFGEHSSYGRDELLAGPRLTVERDGPGFLTEDQNVEVEVITATPANFEPATITRARGPFILAIHNRSGEKDLVLRIHRNSHEQLYEVRLRTGSRRQHQRLDLPPGEYIISEAGHPEWRCQLVINR